MRSPRLLCANLERSITELASARSPWRSNGLGAGTSIRKSAPASRLRRRTQSNSIRRMTALALKTEKIAHGGANPATPKRARRISLAT